MGVFVISLLSDWLIQSTIKKQQTFSFCSVKYLKKPDTKLDKKAIGVAFACYCRIIPLKCKKILTKVLIFNYTNWKKSIFFNQSEQQCVFTQTRHSLHLTKKNMNRTNLHLTMQWKIFCHLILLMQMTLLSQQPTVSCSCLWKSTPWSVVDWIQNEG